MNEEFHSKISSEEDKRKEEYLNHAFRIFDHPFAASTIEAPSRESFLRLAQKGKDVWNAWREAYPNAPVKFPNIDFRRDYPALDFSDFIFFFAEKTLAKDRYPNVDFGGCTFSAMNKFNRCIFDGETNFRSAKFEGSAHFKEANFRDEVSFERASFSEDSFFCDTEFFKKVNFNGAVFNRYVNFRNSVFHSQSSFVATEFIRDANFDGSIFFEALFAEAKFGDNSRFENSKITSGNFNHSRFGSNISFYGASFKETANFTGAKFKDKAIFSLTVFEGTTLFCFSSFGKFSAFKNSSFRQDADFKSAIFNENIDFSGAKFEGNLDFSANLNESEYRGQDHLGCVSFAGAEFKLEANFSGRKFISTTSFGFLDSSEEKIGNKSNAIQPVIFFGTPNFHGCEFSQDTSFDGAAFLAPPSPEAARAYRTLKLAMEKLKATREEQNFFRLEMQAEHAGLTGPRRRLSSLYSYCSDYGFSIKQPLKLLLQTTCIAALLHGALANLHAGGLLASNLADIDWSRTTQWLTHVGLNTLPVPGFDRTQMELRQALFDSKEFKTTADAFILAAAIGLDVLHKLISLGCVFLLGLALRNLFKMKS